MKTTIGLMLLSIALSFFALTIGIAYGDAVELENPDMIPDGYIIINLTTPHPRDAQDSSDMIHGVNEWDTQNDQNIAGYTVPLNKLAASWSKRQDVENPNYDDCVIWGSGHGYIEKGYGSGDRHVVNIMFLRRFYTVSDASNWHYDEYDDHSIGNFIGWFQCFNGFSNFDRLLRYQQNTWGQLFKVIDNGLTNDMADGAGIVVDFGVSKYGTTSVWSNGVIRDEISIPDLFLWRYDYLNRYDYNNPGHPYEGIEPSWMIICDPIGNGSAAFRSDAAVLFRTSGIQHNVTVNGESGSWPTLYTSQVLGEIGYQSFTSGDAALAWVKTKYPSWRDYEVRLYGSKEIRDANAN